MNRMLLGLCIFLSISIASGMMSSKIGYKFLWKKFPGLIGMNVDKAKEKILKEMPRVKFTSYPLGRHLFSEFGHGTVMLAHTKYNKVAREPVFEGQVPNLDLIQFIPLTPVRAVIKKIHQVIPGIKIVVITDQYKHLVTIKRKDKRDTIFILLAVNGRFGVIDFPTYVREYKTHY